MTFIEFIGFIIAIVAFFILMAKQAREQRKRRENPEKYEKELEEQEETIKKLFQSLDIETEEEPAKEPPPVPERAGPPEVEIPRERLSDERAEKDKRHIEAELRRMLKKPKISPKLPKFIEGGGMIFKKPHEEYRGSLSEQSSKDAYKIQKQETSRIQKVLGETGSLKNAIIFREVLGPPKAFDKHTP
jgi:hypothetical protein